MQTPKNHLRQHGVTLTPDNILASDFILFFPQTIDPTSVATSIAGLTQPRPWSFYSQSSNEQRDKYQVLGNACGQPFKDRLKSGKPVLFLF
jgi:hypothetical protein